MERRAPQMTHKSPALTAETRENWRDSALCAQTDPESFFPTQGGDSPRATKLAKRLCNGDPKRDMEPCPVRDECLAAALANDERFGVWGGLSQRDLTKLRRGT